MSAGRIPSCEDVADDLAAWALEGGDLPPELAEHCAGCAACAAIRDEYVGVAGLLPFGAPLAETSPGARGRLRARLSGTGRALPRRRSARAWPAAVAAALVLALGAGAAGFVIGRSESPPSERAPLPGQRFALRAAPGFEGAGANVVVNETTGAAVLSAWGLPPLPAGQVYQFWFLRLDGTRLDAYTFSPDARGDATHAVALPPDFASIRGAWVTQEPAPGSAAPSGPNVLVTWWK